MTTTEAPQYNEPPVPPAEPRPATLRRVLLVLLTIAVVALILLKNAGTFETRPRIALVTASSGPYWDYIIRGAQDAARANKVQLDVISPPSDQQEQAIRGLVGKGYKGVAVSPNDPVLQAKALADLAAESSLVTFDSDSPSAGRLVFIGTDNYDAGRMAGQQVREAIPDGGEVIIAIGSLDKQNGQQRRQGVIDELLERPFERDGKMDPVEGVLKGSKYTVVATIVDGIDREKARTLAGDALKQYPNVKCVVGLFAYNTPVLLKALEDGGRLGHVKVVGFDAYAETLAGIESGTVHGAILQDPHYMGFEAVRILAEVARGNRQAVPLFQTRNVTCEAVTRENLDITRKTLARQGGGAPLSGGDGDVKAATTRPAAG